MIKRKKTPFRLNKKILFIFLMLLPTFAIISFLTVYPTIKGFEFSFQNITVRNLANPSRVKNVGFENFEKIFEDPDFLKILWNTFVWIAGSVFFQLIFGLGLALLMRKPFKGRGIYAGMVFYPWALSGFAIGLLWSWLLNGQYGVINDILIRTGLVKQGIDFLSTESTAMFSVTMVNIWYGIPFFAIMSLAALQSIPNSVYEAAEIDGAGGFTKLFRITIPYIRPTLINTILLRVIWVMNFPDVIYGMTRGGPAKSTEILSVYMINKVYYGQKYSEASAIGVIIVLLLFVYTLIYLTVTKSKEIEL